MSLERSRPTQGVGDQTAVLRLSEQLLRLRRVCAWSDGQSRAGLKLGELRDAVNLLEYGLDLALDTEPIETCCPADGTNRQDETVGDGRREERLGRPEALRPVELGGAAIASSGALGEVTGTGPDGAPFAAAT